MTPEQFDRIHEIEALMSELLAEAAGIVKDSQEPWTLCLEYRAKVVEIELS
jgi:hypothetical protein